MEAKNVRLVLTTVAQPEHARDLARELVNARLAACVNIVPGITSVYRWREGIEEDSEILLLIKTTDERFPELRARLEALHPYEVPELLAFESTAVSDAYLRWLGETTEEA